MKKYIVLMAVLLLLFVSCEKESDFVLDLGVQTESFSCEVQGGVPVIINKNSGTFHMDADCSYLSRMKSENRMGLTVESLDRLLLHGYQPCSRCAKESMAQNDILP